MSNDRILKCPFCLNSFKDGDFCSHIIQIHPDKQGRVRGSYVRWLEGLRVDAGGEIRGGGEGRGLFNV